MSAREQALQLNYGRAALGVALVVAPGLARMWLGDDASSPAVKAMARSFGAREIALGVGTILALEHDAPVRGWLEAGMLADGVDAAATLVAWSHLPRAARLMVTVSAAVAVVTGRRLIAALD